MMKNFGRQLKKAVIQPGYAFKILLKRIEADLYYRFGSGRAPAPESLTLFLTHKCNLKCKMCGQWGDGGVTKKESADVILQELPIDIYKKLIDDVRSFKPAITLFGGEPFLYKGCLDLVRYIKGAGMHCLVITNASRVKDIANDIVESGLDELNVSIDGGAGLHDAIRGMEGLYDNIAASLNEISRIKRAKGCKKPLVNIQCTINRYNYNRIDEMPDVAESLGADSLTFHNLIFTDSLALEHQKRFDNLLDSSSLSWAGFNFSPGIDVDILREKMEKIRSFRKKFDVDIYPNMSYKTMKDYYSSPRSVARGYPARCLSPWLVAYIFPDGEVRPCLNFSYSFGNIRNDSFAGIWNSAKGLNYRRFLKKERLFPVCARCTELYRY